MSGSELVQKFIGEGSRMVRELFVMAREHAPSIIFMDEIDSIGSSRIESGSGGDSEVKMGKKIIYLYIFVILYLLTFKLYILIVLGPTDHVRIT